MLVLSSPSGAGKTTLARALLVSDQNIKMSVSVTTRKKRPDEQEAIDYYFVNKEKYDIMIERGEFLEHAKVFGQYYGTPKQHVLDNLNQGRDVLFDIDWQGTSQIHAKAPDDVVSIFILPPSMKELEERLNKRAQDSQETVQQRMSKAYDEISHWQSYDYVVVNVDITDSLKKISSILIAERFKRFRQPGLADFIKQF